MNELQNIRRLVFPALRNLWLIAIVLVLAIITAMQMAIYSTAIYESYVKINLATPSEGVSGSNLFKDFDFMTTNKKIETEKQIIKSRLLVSNALRKVDFDVYYYRIGTIKTTEILNSSPFWISYTIRQEVENYNRAYGKEFFVNMFSPDSLIVSYFKGKKEIKIKTSFERVIKTPYMYFSILKRPIAYDKAIKNLPASFKFKIKSKEQLISDVVGSLDIKEVAEKVPIVRISMKSPVPEKAAIFVNKLAETYIEDNIKTKSVAAGKTIRFIDQILKDIKVKLHYAELKIEKYKTKHGVINTRQETEAGLKNISQMRIILTDLEMKLVAIDSLNRYINSNVNFLALAPNFEAFGDAIFTDFMKQLKKYQAEKQDLLLKYTRFNEKVLTVDRKIENLINYIKESILNTKKDLKIKKKEMQESIKNIRSNFDSIPVRERNLIVLEREFEQFQDVFNFLTKKRYEAAIAEASHISFHRVLEHARTPKYPVSPKKVLLLVVFCFLAIFLSLAYIYLREFFLAQFRSKQEVEKYSKIPIMGIVRNMKKKFLKPEDDFLTLTINLINHFTTIEQKVISINSTIKKEGKTYVSLNLAKAISMLKYRVIIIDCNLRNPDLHNVMNLPNTLGVSDVLRNNVSINDAIHETDIPELFAMTAGISVEHPQIFTTNDGFKNIIETMKEVFDVIILDNSASSVGIEPQNIMKISDMNLYVSRANYTKTHYLLNADLLKKDLKLDNIYLVINSLHPASNFNGNYSGSSFIYKKKNKNILAKLKHYHRYYSPF